MKKQDVKRVNVHLPQSLVNEYDEIAKEMCVSRSYLMVTALYHYLDYKNTLKTSKQMPQFLDQLEMMKEALNSVDKAKD